MGGLRKFKRGQDRKYAAALTKIAVRHDRKLSEVLLEFAEPLTTMTHNAEDFATAIEIALLAWNLSFLPADERSTFLKESMGTQPNGRDALPFEAEQCIQMLLARKQALFPDDRRIVMHHQLSGGPHDGNLVVAYKLAAK